ncbi:hypothetical protein H0H92_012030 [Tricholoma furcatifolium]|nr:hypothetical protein H0H92_012030 [Tricholoma furcatifolium]
MENSTQDLVPRRYQEEVFVRAQTGNIIAALDTGSGKTLISLLLIRWISSLETSRGRVIIFLVPKVALVEQQGNFIAQNAPLRVIKLHGALDIDLADRGQWKERFNNHDVFVMTAQIFLNLLTHSLWSIDRVSLLVFDECHHTRKNHPYNKIMREYFQTPPAHRPKIFGMTASPIWNTGNAMGSLVTLEGNLDSKVIGVQTHIQELKQYSPKPVEIVQEYPLPSEDPYSDFPSPTLYDCFDVIEKDTWDELEIPWNTLAMRYDATLYNLGPYAASLFLHDELEQHITRLNDHYATVVRAFDNAIQLGVPSQVKWKSPPPDFWQIQDVHDAFKSWFSSESQSDLTFSLTWCTPKVRTLVGLLLAYHTPDFQGIVFVEQRQTATCLATILPLVAELNGLIRCRALMGQGVNKDGIGKATPVGHKDAIASFRRGDINLLIATSVAEEGLDFPACDLVIRFDPVAHMVGYVQSRGRARNKTSTFIVMAQKGDESHIARYQTLKTAEPEVNRAYQSRHISSELEEPAEKGDDEVVGPADLMQRERYVIESSGAVLTYDNSTSLLNHLCSLIPRDIFTPPQVPKYSGEFQVTITLPSSIPVPVDELTFTGPPRCSKKEAKRAAAFIAVKRLHELDVFSDFLLPVTGPKGKETEDVDGISVTDVSKVPVIMDVIVEDPWTMGPSLWIHPVFIDGRPVVGLVTGTSIPPVEMFYFSSVSTGPGTRMLFEDEDDESYKRKLMLEYTRLGIFLRLTARPISLPLSLFLVPLAASHEVDFDAMEPLVAAGLYGCPDWSTIDEEDYGNLVIMNANEHGRPLLLHNIRHDLTPMSQPSLGSQEAEKDTYYDYYVHKWTREKWAARVPTDGPLLEARRLPRSMTSIYNPDVDAARATIGRVPAPSDIGLLPRDCSKWYDMSPDVRGAYEVLPALCHRITDIYRVHLFRLDLGLPPIMDDLLVEALTLPSCDAGFSNQRMETLGDAVLKLCTTVYIYNKYPHRHEGQLTVLRSMSISNRFLLSRAKDIGLEAYLTSENFRGTIWRYVEPLEKYLDPSARRRVHRQYPRRSLQDCMEAVIGASFVSGGIPMALRTGTSLGLSFGGPIPWPLRYSRNPTSSPVTRYFADLEDRLGYTFHRHELLLEAVTHPSMSGGPSYQRLEFLGDALLELAVMDYLYKKFPKATSHELSLPRSKAICTPSLATVAVRRLGLHQLLLVNRLDLTEAISVYVPLLQSATGEEIIKRGWKYDPPKALCDVFESVMGAVLVDSAYNYEKAAAVVETVMEEVLSVLSPSITWDPVSELTQWIAKVGCSKFSIQKKMKITEVESEGVAVFVHGTILAGPIVAASPSVAKSIAAERALTLLKDPDAAQSLSRICDCQAAKAEDAKTPANVSQEGELTVEQKLAPLVEASDSSS